MSKDGAIPLTYAKLVHPEYGYEHDQKNAEQLKLGEMYEVERVSMGQSHTTIVLKGVKGAFSSVQFEFCNGEKQPIDIYNMPEFNPYMQMRPTSFSIPKENTHQGGADGPTNES